jgi:hypothetical protein
MAPNGFKAWYTNGTLTYVSGKTTLGGFVKQRVYGGINFVTLQYTPNELRKNQPKRKAGDVDCPTGKSAHVVSADSTAV